MFSVDTVQGQVLRDDIRFPRKIGPIYFLTVVSCVNKTIPFVFVINATPARAPEMMTNDVLRSVRYMLDLADVHVVNIFKLAGYEVSQQDVASWLKKEGEEGYVECPAISLAQFLDGLIIFRRGKNEKAQAERTALSEINIRSNSNNLALKKLRVAFELKEDDLNSIMDAVGFKISKPELSALLRKEGHKNYRQCGDQFLRNFLKGLTLRIRS